MFDFLVTAEGGLTTAGYVCSVAAIILFLLVVVFLCRKHSSSAKMTTQQLVTCAAALALGFLTSYIRLFKLPFGGSVTLFSMLCITLIGYWYGTKVGVLTGLAFGILQFLQEPYVLSLFQVCCDYILAFGALGLSGLCAKSKKHPLIKGYLLAVIVRGAFHALGGYLYWMDYMPDNFPRSLTAVYPIVYNYGFLLAEAALTIVVLSIPAVSKALAQIKNITTVPVGLTATKAH